MPNETHIAVPGGTDPQGLHRVGDQIAGDMAMVRSAAEACQASVQAAAQQVLDMRREAGVVGDLTRQLAEAQRQLTEVATARATDLEQIASMRAQNAEFEERFKRLDIELAGQGERRTWIPKGVDAAKKEEMQVVRTLGESIIDAGWRKFRGKEQFGTYERSGQSIGTTTEGGVTIPIPIVQDVQYIRPRYGLVRELFTPFAMTEPTQVIPINTAEPLVYYVGEKALPSLESSVLFVSPAPTIVAKTLTAYDIMSLEFKHDVAPAIVSFIAERFLLAISGEEDRVGLVASNDPSTWFGILHATAKGVGNVVMSGNSFELLTHKDLVNLTRGVDDDDAENGMFIFSRYGLGVIEGMIGSDGHPIFKDMPSGPRPTILGYPWRTSRKMPVFSNSAASTPFMIFGNPKRMYFGSLQDIEVVWSTEASFFNGSIVLRLRERFGTETVLGAGLARLITHS